jgi:hypothetical protein
VVFMFNVDEANQLLGRVTALAKDSGDELMEDLAELLSQQLDREASYREHLLSQGLPESITLERFIQHHRNNAGLTGAFKAFSELVVTYEPSEEELAAVVAEVYGPGTPEEWQLDNAKSALIAANKFRLERF